MNTDEQTIYDNENSETQRIKPAEQKKGRGWAKMAGAATAGAAVAGGATVAFHSTESAAATPEAVGDDATIHTATGVNDQMAFGQAFAAARAEVGPGGVFEWHGQLYHTYTKDEWQNMSEEERSAFGDKVEPMASSTEAKHAEAQHAETHHAETHHAETSHAETQPAHETAHAHAADHQAPASEAHTGNATEVTATATGAEESNDVQVLGVVHDADSNMNVAGVVIDGQETILIDADNDGSFDVMAVDANHDNQFSPNEMTDISQNHITVGSLGGFTDGSNPAAADPNADLLAANDGPDYISDPM